MATLKLVKEDSIPFFYFTRMWGRRTQSCRKSKRDVIGVTDTQTEVSVVEICAKGKKDTQHHSQAVFVATDGCVERQKSFYMRFQN